MFSRTVKYGVVICYAYAWLGRWLLVQITDEEISEIEQDIHQIRELFAEEGTSEQES